MTVPAESPDPIEKWLAETWLSELVLTPLDDLTSERVIERLKSEADRHWSINANRSLEYANRIILIGKARGDARQTALGTMSKGDALMMLGKIHDAWAMLEQAGNMFEAAGDEVGWARTRIGRLYLSTNLDCVPEALADAERAHAIFTRHQDEDRLVRLEYQTGLVQNYLGNEQRALEVLQSALRRAITLGEAGQSYVGRLYEIMGLTYSKMGNFQQAKEQYMKAQALAVAGEETSTIARIESSIAEVAQLQGHFRQALGLLNQALEKVKDQPYEMALIQYHMVECYLALNRHAEARQVAQAVIEKFRVDFEARFELARTLLFLATVEAEAGNLIEAESALEEAEAIFASIGAHGLVAIIRLWRGRMALRREDPLTAYQEAVTATSAFDADGQQLKSAAANLLQGQALLALGNFQSAFVSGEKALQISRTYSVPSLRYAAHLLLGRVAAAQNKYRRAVQQYQAAAAAINRVQRRLTITLRTDFLEDKGEASRRLITLYLQMGNTAQAFEALEGAKSQIWLAYLTDRESLRWSREDAASQALIAELESLRAEHQSFYQQANRLPNAPQRPGTVMPEQAVIEMKKREGRMRTITEQLYLRNADDRKMEGAPAFSLEGTRQALDGESMLLEYYSDGENVWAFQLTQHTIKAQRLPVAMKDLKQWVAQLHGNIEGVLTMGPQAPGARALTLLAQRVLARLYDCLIGPLSLHQSQGRLVIVPYGELHFLPFHLLYNGDQYLIERYEIVILPAAGLLSRPAPKRPAGARALAHSWEGRLPYTAAEAQAVQKLFGGVICTEEQATRRAFSVAPVQVLHVATHGQHRLDQPDLSFLQLADGQLYGDDILQQDLSYELVTLSACETGRARVAASEDLIGIGRGFLYAGAGALVLSLWQVGDQSTLGLMGRMYAALRAGASKASALRQAQMSILAEDGHLHPAFWGAFHLVGNPDALSR
jgi:CHAT domain-containing protein